MCELRGDLADGAVEQKFVIDFVSLCRSAEALIQWINALVFEVESEVELFLFGYREALEDVVGDIQELSVFPERSHIDNALTLIEGQVCWIKEFAARETSFKPKSLSRIGGDYSEADTLAAFCIIDNSLVESAYRQDPAFHHSRLQSEAARPLWQKLHSKRARNHLMTAICQAKEVVEPSHCGPVHCRER